MSPPRYPSDLSDQEWAILEPLSSAEKRGRPPKRPHRRVVDAVFCLPRSGCSWRMLPKEYPPWQTVYYHFRKRRTDGRLDPGGCYGVWRFNRERWTSRQVSEVTAGGRVYRRSVSAPPRPREDRVAVPVPDSGVPRRIVDAVREAVLGNRWNPGGDARFWEPSGGILRCGACGRRMRTCVTRKKPDRVYLYYACAKRREGRDACANRSSYRADALELAVRRAVAGLLADPRRVREGFEARMRLERTRVRGTLDEQTGVWLGRLAEVDRMRGAYQAMAARGLMTLDELGARL